MESESAPSTPVVRGEEDEELAELFDEDSTKVLATRSNTGLSTASKARLAKA